MAVNKKEVKQRITAWQKCLPNYLAPLFYGYDKSEQQSERVVSFRLSEKGIKRLRKLSRDNKKDQYVLRILLGCKDIKPAQEFGATPGFAPVFSILEKPFSPSDKPARENYFELEWEPNPPFLSSGASSIVNSGVDQIPPAGAFLFVYNWLEHGYGQLPSVFEAISTNVVKRVKSYTFSDVESSKIVDQFADVSGKETVTLYVHLGVGISVRSHPFSFRPIIEVYFHELQTPESGYAADKSAFYDFSHPCPPYCGGEG